MKTIFTLLCVFFLVTGLMLVTTTKASAAPFHYSQSAKTTSCGWYEAASAQINDQGTGHTLGYVYFWTNGCGEAEGECVSVVSGGHINHCNVGAGEPSGFGGTNSNDVSGNSPIWTDVIDCSGCIGNAHGVVQAINYWGQASTPDYHI